MNGNYTIRKATQTDLAAVMRIEHESFEKDIVEEEKVFADRLAYAVDCNYLLVKTDTGSVCGYFISEIWNCANVDNTAFALGHSVREYHRPLGTTLYISSFALLPEVRGSGIAERFFETALTLITGHFSLLERIMLLVHEDWRKAIRIYEKQGFVRLQTIERFSGFGNRRAFIYGARTQAPKQGFNACSSPQV